MSEYAGISARDWRWYDRFVNRLSKRQLRDILKVEARIRAAAQQAILEVDPYWHPARLP